MLEGSAILTIGRIFTSEFLNNYSVDLGQTTCCEICRWNAKPSDLHVSILERFFTTFLDEV